jgi:hypothetical protein
MGDSNFLHNLFLINPKPPVTNILSVFPSSKSRPCSDQGSSALDIARGMQAATWAKGEISTDIQIDLSDESNQVAVPMEANEQSSAKRSKLNPIYPP